MTLFGKRPLIVAIWAISSTAFGQSKDAPSLTDAKVVNLKTEANQAEGWSDLHSLSGGTNFIKQKGIRGQQDGDSSIYSLNLSSFVGYLSGQHSWNNTLTANEALSETPAMNRMIKSTDQLDLISFYRYQFTPQGVTGSYGRVKGSTSVFDSYSEKSSEVDFVTLLSDGSKSSVNRSNRQRLAGGFAPQEYKESFGFFATPINRDVLRVEVRTGPAAKQFLSRGALAEKDVKETPEIELVELTSARSVGAEAALEAKGTLLAKKLDYLASVEALYPIDFTPTQTPRLKNENLVSYDSNFQLRYNIAEWLALSYNLRSRRDPLIRAQAEVVQNTMLTATLRTSVFK